MTRSRGAAAGEVGLRGPLVGGLLGVLAAAGGCGGGDGAAGPARALPPVAAELPGNTVSVWWPPAPKDTASDAGSLPAGFVERLRPEGIEIRELADGVVAGVAPAMRVGWADLAGSRPFREAFSEVPEGARGIGYVDLQLLFDLLTAAYQDTPLRGAVEASGIRAGIAAVVWGQPGTGPLDEWRGMVLSSGSAAGVFALLGEPPAAPLLADAEGAELRVDGAFRTRPARGMLEDLLNDDGPMAMSPLAAGVGGAFLDLFRGMLLHLDGTFSLRARSPDDFEAAFGIADVAGLEAVLAEFARPLDEGIWMLPAQRFVQITGRRLVVLEDEDDLPPAAGEPAAAGAALPGLRISAPAGWVGEGPGFELELRREDADRTSLHLRVDRSRSGR